MFNSIITKALLLYKSLPRIVRADTFNKEIRVVE
jgi:hypothetical protein